MNIEHLETWVDLKSKNQLNKKKKNEKEKLFREEKKVDEKQMKSR